MHSRSMIHGDLKGVRFWMLLTAPLLMTFPLQANILINKSGRACIADFGLLTIISETSHTTTSSSITNAGTVRWMSPELLHPEHFDFKDSRPTKASDCYALGMVILEVLSGRAPYDQFTQLVVTWMVIEGTLPERPEGPWFTDDLWRTLERCWSPQPKDRPAIEVVLGCLGRVAITWRPLPPGVNTRRWNRR